MSRRPIRVISRSGAPAEYAEVVTNFARALEARSVVPFLGAGISVEPPASLAAAGTLVSNLVEAFREAFRLALKLADHGVQDAVKARRILKRARMEQLLDVLHRTHGPAALKHLDGLRGNVWNDNHAGLAALASQDFLPSIVTLNFDLLIENVLKARGVGFSTECPLTQHVFGWRKGERSGARRTGVPDAMRTQAERTAVSPYRWRSCVFQAGGRIPPAHRSTGVCDRPRGRPSRID